MNKAVTAALAVAIVGGSALGGIALWTSREQPAKTPPSRAGVAVETVRVEQEPHRLTVEASGVVTAANDLDVFPQVEGRLVWLFEGLTPGTVVKRGQALYRIEDRDYQLRVQQVKAELQRARRDLALEGGRRQVARHEWTHLGPTEQEEGDGGIAAQRSLALREPQLEAARADVEAAEASLAAAQLALSRTSFAAPFDAVIVEADAEVGQLASPGTRLLRLVGSDTFWVRAAVPTTHLPQIAIPGIDGEGAPLVARQRAGDYTVERSGRVIRLLSNLEPSSRMARLLCAIDDPLGGLAGEGRVDAPSEGAAPSSERYPMLLDSYVEISIEGKSERPLIELERRALRKGDRAYVLDGGRLDIRELEIAWQYSDRVIVASGLEDGEQVIVSPLAGAVEGMRLRDVAAEETALSAREGAAPDG